MGEMAALVWTELECNVNLMSSQVFLEDWDGGVALPVSKESPLQFFSKRIPELLCLLSEFPLPLLLPALQNPQNNLTDYEFHSQP